MEVPSRPGVCGDGRDVIGYRNVLFARNSLSIGEWRTDRCVAGNLRITLTKESGQVTRVHTQVGGAWPASDARVTELGVVRAREASDYFFSLVPRLESGSGKDRLLIPAVLADADDVTEPLIGIARDSARMLPTRRQAIHWLGILGDPRGIRALHDVIENAREDTRLRKHAIFSLSQSPDVAGAELAYLRGVYPRLAEDELKESIFQAMTQDDAQDAGRWLVSRVLDSNEPLRARKSALFWAGQREATPTSELERVYHEATNIELREHAIFVLSQREDEEALNALMRVAREDKDRDLRAKALFWLAQKHDPRVTKLISDLLLK